jgi:excisionase family DNA binding protein
VVASLDDEKRYGLLAGVMKDHIQENKAFTVKELAQFLKVDEDFVWREIRTGRLRGYRFGRKIIRLFWPDIQEWMSDAKIPSERFQHNKRNPELQPV